MVTNINDDILRDYALCPLRLRYAEGGSVHRNMADVFAAVGNKIIAYYDIGRNLPSYAVVSQWFGALWKKIIGGSTTNTKVRQLHNTARVSALPSFYEWFKDLPKFVPVANNVVVSYKHDGINYTTAIPHLIYIPVRRRLIPVLYRDITVGTSHTIALRDMGIRMAVALVRDLFSDYKIDEVHVNFVGTRTLETFRIGPIDDEFCDTTYSMMDGLLSSIANDYKYPNVDYCKYCEFREICIP